MHKIRFEANASDPDTVSATYPYGRIHYAWSFGDGATSTARNPAHAYAAAGTYAVTLVVTDNAGLSVTKTLSVMVP